jgi:CHAT domain
VYQRALALFIEIGDLGIAREFSGLAEVVWGHLELYLLEPDQYLSELSHASKLATTIACIWMAQGRDPWTAVRALESGRELGSRHGMNTVRSYSFEPVEELLPQLDTISAQFKRSPGSDNGDDVSIGERFASKSKDLIRLLKDYVRSEADLKPFGRQQCMWEAGKGFIIHLITSKAGTYALVTTSDGFQKLHLAKCTHEELCIRSTAFRRAIEMCENQETLKGTANQKLRTMLAWLWKTVARPIVQFLHLSKSSLKLPIVKWIACGVFSQLPIHAAGIYQGVSTDYLDQYAVSSYLSSIRGSVTMRQRKPLIPYYQNSNREFTLFGMSTSPTVPEGKLADLAVGEEKARIFASLGDSFTNNTIDNCNLGMARNMMHWARIIHFTCHGLPHPTDPSKSRLVLLRDDKEPCTVARIRDMEIPNALLLFLSACHSAIDPRARETDEISHLAKAFLLAGFPTVIGTLWQAYQASALDIAAEFYAYVAKEWKADQDEPEPGIFPQALHCAVCEWRDNGNVWKPVDWASWVCFTG